MLLNNMDVSIIIVNYNTKDITQACIDSILSKTKGITYEIILVDNTSTDGSIEHFRNNNSIKFIASIENLGFGKANNLGLQNATGKYIFLLNSDTILLNNAVKEFYDAMEKMPKQVACLGTKLLAEDGITDNNSYDIFPSIKSTFKSLLHIYLPFTKKQFKIRTEETFEVDYIIGADLFIRKAVIDELGLFDPDFFMYFDETNMQLRYNNAGYQSILISTPKIIHLENASDPSKGKSYRSRQIYFESMFLFFKKRYSLFKYLFVRFLCLGYLPLILRKDLSFKEKIKISILFLY